MFRAVFAFILIANLLVCPLRCASCDAGAESIGECVPTTCSCCHHMDDSSQESDDIPVDDCTCSTCLCEGATLQEGVHLSDVGSQPGCLGRGLAAIQSDVGAAVQRIAACENNDGGSAFCGCNASVAFQLWLI